jgi:hypothetical protein
VRLGHNAGPNLDRHERAAAAVLDVIVVGAGVLTAASGEM